MEQNIYLIGPMGAGKTTIGKLLAKKLDREFLDCDEELVKRTGAKIDLIFEIEGEKGFRKRESQLLKELAQRSNYVISTGGGAILKRKNRNALNSGLVIYLKASVDLLYNRTKHDRNRPLLDTQDRYGRIQEILDIREPLYEETADIIFNTEHNSVKKIANDLYKRVTDDD